MLIPFEEIDDVQRRIDAEVVGDAITLNARGVGGKT
jgi:hypothetical protein